MGLFSKINPLKTVNNTVHLAKKILVIAGIVIVSIILLIILSCAGCSSAAAKKDSYNKSGPIYQKQSEGYYHRESIKIEKYSDKYKPADNQYNQNKPTFEIPVSTQPVIPIPSVQKRELIITKQGDKYILEENK